MPTKAGRLTFKEIRQGRTGWIVETRPLLDHSDDHGSLHTAAGEVRLVWIRRVMFGSRPRFKSTGNEYQSGWRISYRGMAPNHDGEVGMHWIYAGLVDKLVRVPHETKRETKLRNMIEGTRPVGVFATRAAVDRYLAQFPILERVYF